MAGHRGARRDWSPQILELIKQGICTAGDICDVLKNEGHTDTRPGGLYRGVDVGLQVLRRRGRIKYDTQRRVWKLT